MIAHKVTFYSNGQRSKLGQNTALTLPPEPQQDAQANNTKLLNTVFMIGALAAVAVLAVTIAQGAASKD